MIAASFTPLTARQGRNTKEEACRKQREDELDRALADTFPASDPPAQISKGTISNPRPQEKAAGKMQEKPARRFSSR